MKEIISNLSIIIFVIGCAIVEITTVNDSYGMLQTGIVNIKWELLEG